MAWMMYIVVIGSVWFSLASFVGARRLRFWPLTLQGVAFAVIGISLAIVLQGGYPRNWFLPLLITVIIGYTCMYIYEFRLKAGRRLAENGITLKKLLLFQTSGRHFSQTPPPPLHSDESSKRNKQ
jgi:CHASE2 domain-containing sensor protein